MIGTLLPLPSDPHFLRGTKRKVSFLDEFEYVEDEFLLHYFLPMITNLGRVCLGTSTDNAQKHINALVRLAAKAQTDDEVGKICRSFRLPLVCPDCARIPGIDRPCRHNYILLPMWKDDRLMRVVGGEMTLSLKRTELLGLPDPLVSQSAQLAWQASHDASCVSVHTPAR